MLKRIVAFLILITGVQLGFCCTNDSTVSITSDQLKYANLIFVEHKKLLEENDLLTQQVQNYQAKTDFLLRTDSLRVAQITNYQLINKTYATQIEDLNKAIKKKNRAVTCWKIGGITVSVGLVLFLLLK